MIEVVLILFGILILVWLVLPKKKPAIQRPKMPSVKPSAPPIPYSQGRLVRPTSRQERRSEIIDDLLSFADELGDALSTRKSSKRSDNDHGYSDSSNWDILDD